MPENICTVSCLLQWQWQCRKKGNLILVFGAEMVLRWGTVLDAHTCWHSRDSPCMCLKYSITGRNGMTLNCSEIHSGGNLKWAQPQSTNQRSATSIFEFQRWRQGFARPKHEYLVVATLFSILVDTLVRAGDTMHRHPHTQPPSCPVPSWSLPQSCETIEHEALPEESWIDG